MVEILYVRLSVDSMIANDERRNYGGYSTVRLDFDRGGLGIALGR